MMALLVTLLLCLPPLLIDLGKRLSTHTMENVALVTSQETWLRWHQGEPHAWLVTTNDGLPRVEKPPLLAWLNFLAWSDLDPQTATPVDLTHRARMVTAILGLIMLASIFWLGCTLGDVWTGVLAALAAGSMFFFQRQARTASYDIHAATWATLAIACGLWAMRPRGPAPSTSRRIAGWTIAGLAMACSVMSKNPLSYVIVLLPLIAAVALVPERRLANGLGLAAALLIALMPVIPWYIHVVQAYDDAARTLNNELRQRRSHAQPVYYYLGLLGLIIPWTVWFICGLVHPFKLAGKERRVALVALVWFALIFLLFSAHPAKQQRYILPAIPAAALVTVQFLRYSQAMTDEGRPNRFARTAGSMLWAAILIGSLLFGPFLAFQDWLVEVGGDWYPQRVTGPLSLTPALIAGAVLAALAVIGWRFHHQSRGLPSGVTLALWALTATSVFWYAYAGAPTEEIRAFKMEAERLRRLVGEAPVRSLRITEKDHRKYKLNEEFRFYYGKLIRRITAPELTAYSNQSVAPVYVLSKPDEKYIKALRKAGYRQVDNRIATDKDDVQELWVSGN